MYRSRSLVAASLCVLVFAQSDMPARAQQAVVVSAVGETRPLFGDDAGGNADGDDPAIWVDPKDPPRAWSWQP